MHKIIEDLNWRYATKQFDVSKKISSSDIEIIKESLRLTASSYGLQPNHFLIVENVSLREQLVPASYGQKQVLDASHLIVICAYNDLTDKHVDEYVENIISTRESNPDQVKNYGNFMKKTFSEMSSEDKLIWASKQAYIALGQLLHTCATLRIDSTPMEGFIPERYSEILSLKDKHLTPILVCPIGYRHKEDSTQHLAKVRKDQIDLFDTIK